MKQGFSKGLTNDLYEILEAALMKNDYRLQESLYDFFKSMHELDYPTKEDFTEEAKKIQFAASSWMEVLEEIEYWYAARGW